MVSLSNHSPKNLAYERRKPSPPTTSRVSTSSDLTLSRARERGLLCLLRIHMAFQGISPSVIPRH